MVGFYPMEIRTGHMFWPAISKLGKVKRYSAASSAEEISDSGLHSRGFSGGQYYSNEG